MKAISDAAFKMARRMIEIQIEECEEAVSRQERRIKQHKLNLALFDKIAKELAKPPKPFKMPKLTKAQRKAMARMPMGPTIYDGAPVRPSPVTSHQSRG